MFKHFLTLSTLGGLLLLAGAGCPSKTEVSVDTSTEATVNTPTTPTITPAIAVSDQVISANQVMINKSTTAATSWVVIHLVENGNPGKIIGQTQVSAGDNEKFTVSVAGKLTAELVAMLHVDVGQAGAFEPAVDMPVTGADGLPIMVKFKVLTKAAATSEAKMEANVDVKVDADVKVPSKPLSQELPAGVTGAEINALNLPAPKPAEPTQPVPEPSVKSFSLTAKNWEFVPSTITVNKGDTVKLTITATDVTHGFFLADFNVSATLEPNQPKTVQFVADKTGTFSFRCSVFCGDGHSGMRGTLIVK